MIRYPIIFFATWILVAYSLSTVEVSPEWCERIGIVCAAVFTHFEMKWQRFIKDRG
ncbi:hypothetical protein MPK67_gp054 [Erwinia phage pEa_SNUABM_32]|uniref:Uncharacterized protein n=2 Tax=Alexandravirus TaxID=2733088 RepID=A0AAE7XIW7_9CAUD|nr:hypothetical protein MPK67_gp054 [Erwinia phage pEa_SNUABM_32]YP_010301167.1 hypothetical protein MPK68_gp054 [Erwinia phage pEa_SNUABM_3]QZE56590.1 hypothetical protein pEaSNUABM20_00054 [Erwinia phage pEa_SNUABM_20]QZE58270.1 hypothetical protein pEaSNUABM40_00054 [Erwinia phage pEa_SNUABM_40]UAW52835.1 hypothetical protein pEaSNUABM23_00053 [Erwinia phage pEa_SNUABM_23]UIW10731.1 hypothetical protein pEaSNUABM23_00053 [Erwinia phage pEa_SNUABM_31]QZE56251.1 hypothetical protein pEaSNUAB